MRAFWGGLILLLPLLAVADTTSDAFNAGAEFGKGNKGQGTNSLNNPDSVTGSIPGYTSNPPETGYYGGINGDDGGLVNKGMEGLLNSNAGQAVIDAGTKNPLPVIDPNAPFITAGKDAEANADGMINGTGNPQQCQESNVSKSEFEKYTCERDAWIEQSCSRTAKIVIEGDSTWETQTVQYELNQVPMQEINGRNVITIVPQVGGEIIQATYSWQNNTGNKPRFFMDVSILGAAIPWHNKGNYQNVSFTPVPATLTAGVPFTSSHPHELRDGSGRQKFYTHVPMSIRLVLRVKKNNSVPKVEWTESCGFQKSRGVLAAKSAPVFVSSVCSEAGGYRPVTIDGVVQQVWSDCWEYLDQYLVQSGSNGTCEPLMNDPACTVTGTQCLTQNGSYCEHEKVNYECQRTFTSGGIICGGEYFCKTGDCSDTDGAGDSGFDEAVSKLAGLASAADDVKNGQNAMDVRAFTGKVTSCRKAIAGFSNCCKDSGWGQDIGLSACNSEELALGKAKAKKITVSVGERCDREVLGVCLQKSKVYCVFEGKLARIIQEQGRRDQLGVGFGSGKNPDCRGITIPELQNINFDLINFSDFYSDLMDNQKIPDSSVMVKQVKDRIAAQVQQQQGQGGKK
ncbi:type-F conjugative transfer system mating-pair stabilization protein TraN [Salmonella enterica]|nr:type-F conjugative transfer system mating-pair stabilization protein TraN [Salmonella enterica]HEC6701059.1 type-F conjugative transfer system mating-pair stabilization protein TraN [Salmonella enterica subsp. enterica serovar Weltevreden]HEC6913973.1 type-F conjugative transfer system mating-pair stabilization protein TraN [Salmonella enterica subsp. enterica serovar Weltevreden]